MSEDYMSLNIFTLAKVTLISPHPCKIFFSEHDTAINESFLVLIFILLIDTFEKLIVLYITQLMRFAFIYSYIFLYSYSYILMYGEIYIYRFNSSCQSFSISISTYIYIIRPQKN